MSFFNIDFSKATTNLIPPLRRGDKMRAWLKALTKPLQTLNDDFANNYAVTTQQSTKYNGQVIVLEKILNDFFSVTGANLIYIDNIEPNANGFFIAETDNDDASSVGAGLDNEDFIGVNYTGASFDFQINVPNGFGITEEQVRNETNKYKLTGTNYSVVFY